LHALEDQGGIVSLDELSDLSGLVDLSKAIELGMVRVISSFLPLVCAHELGGEVLDWRISVLLNDLPVPFDNWRNIFPHNSVPLDLHAASTRVFVPSCFKCFINLCSVCQCFHFPQFRSLVGQFVAPFVSVRDVGVVGVALGIQRLILRQREALPGQPCPSVIFVHSGVGLSNFSIGICKFAWPSDLGLVLRRLLGPPGRVGV